MKQCISWRSACAPCQALLAHTYVSLKGDGLNTDIQACQGSLKGAEGVSWGHMLIGTSGITALLMQQGARHQLAAGISGFMLGF